MELAEIIRQFETSLLRVVFTELAYRSYAFPRWLASFPEDKANNYENSWAPYGNIGQAFSFFATLFPGCGPGGHRAQLR